MKIVINVCHGGFSLSDKAYSQYIEDAKVPKDLHLSMYDIPRNDENLVNIILNLKEESWGRYSNLQVLEIPDDIDWQIYEYDGWEWICEKHRSWHWNEQINN